MAKNLDLYIGLMSGTSLDGVDAALTDFADEKCSVIATHFVAYPSALKKQLLALHQPQPNEFELVAILANELAQLYAQAVHGLLQKANIKPAQVTAIGNHGQTIRHRPELGFTSQIGNNALLAELTHITVVGDFRSRDIAAGGQGAPLVPAFHQAVFGSTDKNRAIINLGGIANITYLPALNLKKPGKVIGFDSGPGNMLLDAWAKQHIGTDYDANGDWAATGEIIRPLLSNLLAEPYYALPPPKSTGRDLFNDTWLQQRLSGKNYQPQDVARTLVALTAHSIFDALVQDCGAVDEVFLCGGGAHNGLLKASLQEFGISKLLSFETETAKLLSFETETAKPLSISTTNDLGIDVDYVEAACFAWLAKQTCDNKPSNLPAVTGAKGLRVLGAIYPA